MVSTICIFDDDIDEERFFEISRQLIQEFKGVCHTYCLMTNHYQLVIETPDSNSLKGMRQLNGVFTQASNHRHQRRNFLECGHRLMNNYRHRPPRPSRVT
jgi:putative transposase